jgi:phosphoribosylformylglycinamidine cyclo-ligase
MQRANRAWLRLSIALPGSLMKGQDDNLYREVGVDIAAAESGLKKIVDSIRQTWPAADGIGAVKLDIGYFANVIDIGGVGLAICTDGVGSKSIIAGTMKKYDTIGIDCGAMNVNDVICVGARPISMVDYIAVEAADADMLGAIAVGLAEGARQAGISISGGEIAQLKDVMRGFDLVGMAVGLAPLDRIITGRDLTPGDAIIGIESNGIHSNGLTLARHVLFDRAKLSVDHVFPELEIPLGEELLRPTLIYVPEVLDIIEHVPTVKALINITGDGLLNLARVDAKVGFEIDNLPPAPPIFRLIQQEGAVAAAEMFEVYNMGVGFCVLAADQDVGAILAILERRRRRAQVIGRVIADDGKGVYLPAEKLVGHGKRFRRE